MILSGKFKNVNLPGRQRGAHAAAFIMTVFALTFAAGMGIDAGRMFVVKSEVQHAADACALAAASALTGGVTSLQTAEDFGFTAGLANRVNFQKTALTPSFIRDSTVTFSATLTGTYHPKSSANVATAKYVRCTLDSPGVSFFLFQVANAVVPGTVGQKVIGATAIATLDPSISACIMPLGICAKDPAAADWGFTKNEWLCGRRAPGGTSLSCDATTSSQEWSGSFRWLKLPGYESVPEIRALIQGTAQCAVAENLTTVPSKTGNINGLKGAWNSRFGAYDGNFSGVPDETGAGFTDGEVTDGPPTWGNGAPWSGESPPGFSAFDEFKNKRTTNVPWDGGGWLASPDVSLSSLSQSDLASQGSDRRVVPLPVIGCPGTGSGANRDYDVHGFACMLMLAPIKNPTLGMKLEYLGDANDVNPANNPCAANGLPGGGAGPKVPGLVY